MVLGIVSFLIVVVRLGAVCSVKVFLNFINEIICLMGSGGRCWGASRVEHEVRGPAYFLSVYQVRGGVVGGSGGYAINSQLDHGQ